MEPVSSFNWVDIVALVVIVRITYIAIHKGFVIEFFKAAGTFSALFLSYHFYSSFADFFIRHISFLNKRICVITGFLAIYFLVYILFRYIREGITLLFKIEPHHIIERWIALILGALRGFLILGVIFFSAELLDVAYITRSVKTAVSYPAIKKVLPFAYKAALPAYKNISDTKRDKK